ncbi:MAG: hypothetical protein HUU15_13495 [Candidatus Brocadiae bacterium]|nr:hypothetical protein [Candidatus Brocadiia bacterium]
MDLTDRSAANPAVQVARRFQVSSLPDLRVLSANGEVLGTIDPAGVDDLIEQLTPHTRT